MRLENRHALACGPLHRVKNRMLTHGGSAAARCSLGKLTCGLRANSQAKACAYFAIFIVSPCKSIRSTSPSGSSRIGRGGGSIGASFMLQRKPADAFSRLLFH